MPKDMNKYRISLPLKKGKYVACESPDEAVQACFPDTDIEEHSSGHKWIRYRTSDDLPEGWPDNTEGGGGGKVVDLELVGEIMVVDDE